MSRTIDKAVILAAGRGNRISAVSRDTPKPFLPLDGRAGGPTFLDWHLACLQAAGVKEIYLVGNRVTFGRRLAAMERVRAEWILNPTEDLQTSGSGHSAQFAWRSPHGILDGRSRVLLMDADIVYDPAALLALASAPGDRSKTLVSQSWRDTDEEVLVFAKEGRPRMHGKGLLRTPLVEGMECLGEATGMVLLEPEDHALVRGATDWLVAHGPSRARVEHEEITAQLMGRDRVDGVVLPAETLFMEVDTPEEYEVLTRTVFPRLAALAPAGCSALDRRQA